MPIDHLQNFEYDIIDRFEILDMQKGVLSTELIVLLALYDSEMSGVEVLHFINESSGEPGFVPRGSVYSALQKLEDKRLVQSRVFDDRSRAGARRYYRLTDGGKAMIDSVLEFQSALKEKSKED